MSRLASSSAPGPGTDFHVVDVRAPPGSTSYALDEADVLHRHVPLANDMRPRLRCAAFSGVDRTMFQKNGRRVGTIPSDTLQREKNGR